MNYQNETLPQNATKVGETKSMTEETVIKGLLKNHALPAGRFGLLVVESGTIQMVWEADGVVHDADSDHPIVIFPERTHHVQFNGAVAFRVEFYQ